jgi:acetyltransferase-like isoleucine patch superfamily enzyme
MLSEAEIGNNCNLTKVRVWRARVHRPTAFAHLLPHYSSLISAHLSSLSRDNTTISLLRFVVPQVFLGERVKLLEGVTLGPGCVIGDNVVIGPNVSLPANTKVSTVMPEVRV